MDYANARIVRCYARESRPYAIDLSQTELHIQSGAGTVSLQSPGPHAVRSSMSRVGSSIYRWWTRLSHSFQRGLPSICHEPDHGHRYSVRSLYPTLQSLSVPQWIRQVLLHRHWRPSTHQWLLPASSSCGPCDYDCQLLEDYRIDEKDRLACFACLCSRGSSVLLCRLFLQSG